MRIKFNSLFGLGLCLGLVGGAFALDDGPNMELLEQVLGILRMANVVKGLG